MAIKKSTTSRKKYKKTAKVQKKAKATKAKESKEQVSFFSKLKTFFMNRGKCSFSKETAVLSVFWGVLLMNVMIIPFVSTNLTRLWFLLFNALIFVIFVFVVILKKGGYSIPISRITITVLGFTLYLFIRYLFSVGHDYRFWDKFLFMWLNPTYFLMIFAFLWAVLILLTSFKDGAKRALFALPCWVFIVDFLGILLSKTAFLIKPVIGLLSSNAATVWYSYFQSSKVFAFYPEFNIWFILHIISLFIVSVLLVRNYKNPTKVFGLSIIGLFMLWNISSIVGSISFLLLLITALFILGFFMIIRNIVGSKQGVIFTLFGLLITLIVNLLQILLKLKRFTLVNDFWGGLSLINSYNFWNKVVQINSIVPNIFAGNPIINVLFGIGPGLFNTLSSILSPLVNTSQSGFLVLLSELGVIGVLFWGYILYRIFRKALSVKQNLTYSVAFWSVLFIMTWYTFTNISVWGIIFIIVFLFIFAVIYSSEKINVVFKKVKNNRPVKYNVTSIHVLIVLIISVTTLILVFQPNWKFFKYVYGTKLREQQLTGQTTETSYKTLLEALKYANSVALYCNDCDYSKVLRLEVLNKLDSLIVSNQKFVEAKKITKSDVEQIQDSLLSLSYDLAPRILINEANFLTGDVFAKLAGRRKSEYLTQVALSKYDDTLLFNPLNYKVINSEINILLTLNSKKGDNVYLKLNNLFAKLAQIARYNQQLAFDVALTQSRFYLKYKEYDKALETYEVLKNWLSKQTFKSDKEKKQWIEALNELADRVKILKEKNNQQTETPKDIQKSTSESHNENKMSPTPTLTQ